MKDRESKHMSADPVDLRTIKDALSKKKLVFVFGTGVSNALTTGAYSVFSWTGLIESAFHELIGMERVSLSQADSWMTLSRSKDIDDVLGAAEFVGRKFEAPTGALYARWLETTFSGKEISNEALVSALRGLRSSGAKFASLNYDTLVEEVLGATSVTTDDVRAVRQWMDRYNSVLHLHGVWSKPLSCLFGIRDYEYASNDEIRDLLQNSLLTYSTLVFVGCGSTFEDPNFRRMASWLKNQLKGHGSRHFVLTRRSDYKERKADPALHGFVEPLIFGDDHNDLGAFLQQLVKSQRRARVETKGSSKKVAFDGYEDALSRYRAFLLKDCGQMTIEGLRADMDTAQRKFDIERLFVPLTVAKVPPILPESDKDREQKLREWLAGEGAPKPFGAAMSSANKIALLALPGGGKTLLLKRLAVAYADPVRHDAAGDKLPKEGLVPILIRCREWRGEIRKPIIKIIEAIPDQAGEVNLLDFASLVAAALSANSLMLLVDGLDEIHDDADRVVFVDNLEKFVETHPKIRLIVTSREAGFDLVAPSLSRFCERYRVSPLSEQAITDLCMHWHTLMGEDALQAQKENKVLVDQLLRNNALRRLAENPLLLTMLLVVKHGAGRLPPDRVSLYERAVDVLVDTWNIKGHAPLGLKEAVPQLACIAYELMKKGAQTATRVELIAILESARQALPQLGRYSKDTPDEFLRRVELRSSLLLEGGRVAQGISTVPFYQFRHLTFQEYLAAYAAAEGAFIGYRSGDDILAPLKEYVASTEWKEVIPMAAVLARKQAFPLIKLLLMQAQALARDLMEGKEVLGAAGRGSSFEELPFAIRQLIRCIVEEAEFVPEDVVPALKTIAMFARGCRSADDWQALAEGPYGADLLQQAILQYRDESVPEHGWSRNTACALATLINGVAYWKTVGGRQEVKSLLSSSTSDDVLGALMIVMGVFWLDADKAEREGEWFSDFDFTAWFEHSDPFITELAVWAWAIQVLGIAGSDNSRVRLKAFTQAEALALVRGYFRFVGKPQVGIFDFALTALLYQPRGTYTVSVVSAEAEVVARELRSSDEDSDVFPPEGKGGAWIIGYLSRCVTDEQLRDTFVENESYRDASLTSAVRKELGMKMERRRIAKKASKRVSRKRSVALK